MSLPKLQPSPTRPEWPVVVDLGTKKAGALEVFLAHGSEYFGRRAQGLVAADCLGIDLKSEYQSVVEAMGYRFLALDVLDEKLGQPAALPAADYYLAFDFLEHLPSREDADRVLKVMLTRARRGVWLRMPSFEQDSETGEGRLRGLGLRFAWTDWKGHPTHYLLADANQVFETAPRVAKVRVKPGRRIHATDDHGVVPLSAPCDTVRYTYELGPKQLVRFEAPLVAQWEVLVELREPGEKASP